MKVYSYKKNKFFKSARYAFLAILDNINVNFFNIIDKEIESLNV